LYLEDFGKRPPDLEALASAKYLGDGRILACPADRSTPAVGDLAKTFTPAAASSTPALRVSYRHPLGWSDEDWNRLMQAQTRAGVVVCTFHDVAAPRSIDLAMANPSPGLVLRGQLDGTVVRRQVYSNSASEEAAPPPFDTRAATPTSAFGAADNMTHPSEPPWEFFSDDPPP
jgi:hypothetical protein